MEAYYSTWQRAASPAGAPAARGAQSARSPPRGRQEAEEGRDAAEAQGKGRHGARAMAGAGDGARPGKDDGDSSVPSSSVPFSLPPLRQALSASEPAAHGAHVEEETEDVVLCEETVRRWTKSLASHVDAFAPPLDPPSSVSLPHGWSVMPASSLPL